MSISIKKIQFFFLLVVSYGSVWAQSTPPNTEGMVVYEEKINLHRRMQDEAMKARVPEFRSTNMQLAFRDEESLYKMVEEDEDEEINGGQMRFRRPSSEVYRHVGKGIKIEEREFNGKKYLIEDSLTVRPWKIGTETKKIAGFECFKATLKDSIRRQEVNIVAWFSPDIPLAVGPSTMGSLPGMILEVDMNEGEVVTTAKSIKLGKVKAGELKVPTKGERISEADFRKLMADFMRNNPNGMRFMRN